MSILVGRTPIPCLTHLIHSILYTSMLRGSVPSLFVYNQGGRGCYGTVSPL